MDIPTEEDWRSEPWGIETPWAYKLFFGKTFEEAVRLFEDDSLVYQTNVRYMPGRVFGYYLRAYMSYLMSPAAEEDSDGASCFLGIIKRWTEESPEIVTPLWPEIEPVLHRLADHQDFFTADWAIYGSFRTRVAEIVKLGFVVNFDCSSSEVVPKEIRLADMDLSNCTVSMDVAAQVFANSGISEMSAVKTRSELVAVLGPPDSEGGGQHPTIGFIQPWARYDRPECSIRFEFEGEAIVSVMFMGRGT